jgi:hypothetical protein
MQQAEVKKNRTDRIEQPSRKLLRENMSSARKALGSAFGSRAKVSDMRGTLFHGPRSENARNEKGALLFSQLSLGPLQCSLNFNSRTGS